MSSLLFFVLLLVAEYVHCDRGNYAKAIQYYQEALAIMKEVGNGLGVGDILGNLGNAYSNISDYNTAIKYHQQSLERRREIGNRSGESISLNNLGNVYRFLGQYQRSIEYHQQSLKIFREIGDRSGEGIALNNLGLTLFKTSQLPVAENQLFSARTCQ